MVALLGGRGQGGRGGRGGRGRGGQVDDDGRLIAGDGAVDGAGGAIEDIQRDRRGRGGQGGWGRGG